MGKISTIINKMRLLRYRSLSLLLTADFLQKPDSSDYRPFLRIVFFPEAFLLFYETFRKKMRLLHYRSLAFALARCRFLAETGLSFIDRCLRRLGRLARRVR